MISFYLSTLYTEDDLKAIVVERWGYNSLPSLPLSFNLKKETKEKILKAGAIAEHAGFQILFFQLDEEKNPPPIKQLISSSVPQKERLSPKYPKPSAKPNSLSFPQKMAGGGTLSMPSRLEAN